MTFEAYSLLLRLHNSPGLYIHDYWWKAWGMENWAPNYASLLPSSRKIIDFRINNKRDLAGNVARDLSDFQLSLLMAYPVIEKVLISMGILNMRCPDYLFSRNYRQSLLSYFSVHELEYLMALWHGGSEVPVLPEDKLMTEALMLSCNTLSASFPQDPVWFLIKFKMPAFELRSLGEVFDIALFHRIRKFL